MHTRFSWHIDWKKWVIGFRWMWRRNIRFIVLELGPVDLVWEVEPERDYSDA